MLPRLMRPHACAAVRTKQANGATWLELVSVVAIAALAGRLSDEYSLAGALKFIGLFVPV